MTFWSTYGTRAGNLFPGDFYLSKKGVLFVVRKVGRKRLVVQRVDGGRLKKVSRKKRVLEFRP